MLKVIAYVTCLKEKKTSHKAEEIVYDDTLIGIMITDVILYYLDI